MDSEVTPQEAAELAGVNVQTIYSWIKRGLQGKKLSAKKKQGRVVIIRSDLDRFIEETTKDF